MECKFVKDRYNLKNYKVAPSARRSNPTIGLKQKIAEKITKKNLGEVLQQEDPKSLSVSFSYQLNAHTPKIVVSRKMFASGKLTPMKPKTAVKHSKGFTLMLPSDILDLNQDYNEFYGTKRDRIWARSHFKNDHVIESEEQEEDDYYYETSENLDFIEYPNTSRDISRFMHTRTTTPLREDNEQRPQLKRRSSTRRRPSYLRYGTPRISEPLPQNVINRRQESKKRDEEKAQLVRDSIRALIEPSKLTVSSTRGNSTANSSIIQTTFKKKPGFKSLISQVIENEEVPELESSLTKVRTKGKDLVSFPSMHFPDPPNMSKCKI